jgi:hypothetical protein
MCLSVFPDFVVSKEIGKSRYVGKKRVVFRGWLRLDSLKKINEANVLRSKTQPTMRIRYQVPNVSS